MERRDDDLMECRQMMTLPQLISKFWRGNKSIIVLYFAFLIIYPIQNFLIPHLFSIMYSKVEKRAPMRSFLFLILFLTVFIQSTLIFSEYVELQLQPRIQKFVSDEIINQVFQANRGNFNEQHVSRVIGLIAKLPITFYNYFAQIKTVLIPSMIGLLVSAVYLAYMDRLIGLIFVCALIVSSILIKLSLHQCDSLSLACDKDTSEFAVHVDDLLSNLQTILNFDKSQDEMKIISEKFIRQRQTCDKTFACSLKTKLSIIPLMVAFVVFSIMHTYSNFMKGEVQGSRFIAIILTNFFIIRIVLTLTSEFKNFIIRAGIVKSSMSIFYQCNKKKMRIDEDEDEDEDENQNENQNEDEDKNQNSQDERKEKGGGYKFRGIELRNVSFYRLVMNTPTSVDEEGDGKEKLVSSNFVIKPILHNISIQFPKRKTTLIVGKIGSGKSTILNLIMKNQSVSRGEILVDGKNIEEIDPLHEKVFMIPQTPRLFDRSIYENIIYGLRKQIDRETVREKMYAIGLGSFLETLTHGLDTRVGYLGSNLSGGQKQMVWITKGFFLDVDYILLDEPTASIDEASKDIIMNLLKTLIQTKTIIMVTHDKYLMQFADKTITLHDGRVRHEDCRDDGYSEGIARE